ncbi:MAG: glycerol-3-phosphate dehydrogenase (NAD(P)+) [Candidatus Tokpelaia sp. JSC161]|jgi:glycerol-3-phosphate dehydrogenase (NAD(P)+)|nr:MAG: glycerol-3-phosphate dehydrogenase (NAD(P)+) [Candidatus Tokpelaia sp. JSC161]
MKGCIAILGGGAWGTALAITMAHVGYKISLYVRDDNHAETINSTRTNNRYLPTIRLPQSIQATSDPYQAFQNVDLVMAAIPAQTLSIILKSLISFIPQKIPLVLCSKGIERLSGRFMSDIAKEICPQNLIATLSGPGFAEEVAKGLPTAVTIAAHNHHLAHRLAYMLSGPVFRCYASSDMMGVELGGSLKNVLALAAGITVGRGLGASAQAAIITRGFAEIRRIGKVLGCRTETMTGLSVLGDLILTCSSPQSRNYRYGTALGSGQETDGFPLAEGVATAPISALMYDKYSIDAPIIRAVASILTQEIKVDDAIEALINRPLKFED